MSYTNTYTLTFDGAATKEKHREASFGFVLKLNGEEIDRGWGLIGRGDKMNEVMAEMEGLSSGLDSFVRKWTKPNAQLKIYGDSVIVLRKAPKDPIVRFKLQQIKSMGVDVSISWLPREQNKASNDLAKKLRQRF